MKPNLQRRIQRYGWDKAAEHYDQGWRDSLREAQLSLLEMADAQPGEQVLDIACGTGLVTFPLADAVGPQGRVVATDISQKMIDMIALESGRRGYTQIDAFRADAESLDGLGDGQFDLVTCALGLMYVPNPKAAVSEMVRVLRPGGRAAVAVWGERKNCGWAEIFPIVDARVRVAAKVLDLVVQVVEGSGEFLGRRHHRDRCRTVRHDPTGRLDPVEPRHVHVHGDEVGTKGLGLREDLLSVLGDADDEHVGLVIEELAQELLHDDGI